MKRPWINDWLDVILLGQIAVSVLFFILCWIIAIVMVAE